MNARSFLACLAVFGALDHVNASTNIAGATFFKSGTLHNFEVLLSADALQSLRTAPREYVPATVRADGQTFANVGVHLKGVATFRPVDDQPSLTLNFSKFVREQRFHGLRKIHLNNGKEDSTFLCEALSAEVFARAGLPAPRVAHTQAHLNGRALGLYVAIEGFTQEFLARYFEDTSGNLYDSGFRHDITYPLEQLLGKKSLSRNDLDDLAAAAKKPDFGQRWTELAQRLDTNAFARYLAMQVLTANWDGYAFFKNNYRVYHDPRTHHLHFMAHGMDQTFARATFPLIPTRWEGLVARAFVETPPGRALFEQQLGILFTNVYQKSDLGRRAEELAAVVRPVLVEEGTVMGWEREVARLRFRLAQREQFLSQQFATTNWMTPRVPGIDRFPVGQPRLR